MEQKKPKSDETEELMTPPDPPLPLPPQAEIIEADLYKRTYFGPDVPTLELECWEEELSECQLQAYKNADDEYKSIQNKLDEMVKETGEVVYNSDQFTAYQLLGKTRGGRRSGRGVRTRGGGGRGAGRGTGAQRPNIDTNYDLGQIEDLPISMPLETPLHPPKRRCLPVSVPHGYWYNEVRGDAGPTPGPSGLTRGDAGSAPELTPGLSDPPSPAVFVECPLDITPRARKLASTQRRRLRDEETTPGPFGLTRGDAGSAPELTPGLSDPPSPAVFVECPLDITPRARKLASTQRRRLRDEETGDLLEYGSEEEEDRVDDDSEPMVPRALRMFFEPEMDPPEEAEAAGRVEVTPSPEAIADDGEGVPHGPASLYEFDWHSYPTDPIPPQERREVFVGNSGPVMEPTTNPYDIFVRIWDRSIMEHIVAQTNLYAQEVAAHYLESGLMRPHSRITSWVDTNVDEMYLYFAIILAMGVVVKSKIEEYWSQEGNIFQTPYFSTQMSLRRFQLLNRCIHFNDNSRLTDDLSPREAKIFKVAPVVDHLNSKFCSLYNLHQNVALDESLTQWKGWLNIKQYISNKKSAVGIKTYEVCDSRTGYLWRFEVHAGAEHHPDNVGIINGDIPNLVLRLLRGLEHSGRTIWMDNYYNSPSLARVLKTLGLDCVGTLRTNRQFVPNEIGDLKKGNMRIGQTCGCTSGDVDLMVWRDQNRVAMISTYHGIDVADGKPIVVKDYNVCMGGVDRKDQLLSMYPIERKRTSVWYKKFFKRLLNVSVLNAYIIGKSFDPTLEHRDFRQDLILELIKRHRTIHQPIAEHSQATQQHNTRANLAHLPTERLEAPGPGHGKLRRKCVHCKIKRTIYFCPKCDKSLCFGKGSTCYVDFDHGEST